MWSVEVVCLSSTNIQKTCHGWMNTVTSITMIELYKKFLITYSKASTEKSHSLRSILLRNLRLLTLPGWMTTSRGQPSQTFKVFTSLSVNKNTEDRNIILLTLRWKFWKINLLKLTNKVSFHPNISLTMRKLQSRISFWSNRRKFCLCNLLFYLVWWPRFLISKNISIDSSWSIWNIHTKFHKSQKNIWLSFWYQNHSRFEKKNGGGWCCGSWIRHF